MQVRSVAIDFPDHSLRSGETNWLRSTVQISFGDIRMGPAPTITVDLAVQGSATDSLAALRIAALEEFRNLLNQAIELTSGKTFEDLTKEQVAAEKREVEF